MMENVVEFLVKKNKYKTIYNKDFFKSENIIMLIF